VKDNEKGKQSELGSAVFGFAVAGCLVVGVAASICGGLAMIGGRFLDAGVCFVAAALAFGLPCNGLFRL
jgi:hypothetical protein